MEWDEAQIFPLEVIKKARRSLATWAPSSPKISAAPAWATSSTPSSSKSFRAWIGSVGIIVAAHTSLCTNHIYIAGTDDQRQRYIPKLATGRMDRLLVA